MTNPSVALAGAPILSRHARALAIAPRGLVLLGLAIVVLSTPAVLLADPSLGILFDDAQQLAAVGLAAAALVLAAIRSRGEARFAALVLAGALALVAGGLVAWSSDAASRMTAGGPAVGLFGAAILLFGGTLVWTAVHGTPRAELPRIALESLIVAAAVTTLLTAVWGRFVDPSGIDPARSLGLVASIGIVAGPGGTYLALLNRRVQPGMWGPFVLLDALTLGGFCWLGWQMLVMQGTEQAVSAFDPLLSIAVLGVAWAGITWQAAPEATERFRAFARTASDAFAITAVVVCVTLDLVVTSGYAEGVVRLGAAAVVALTLGRQVMLIRSERRTHLAEQASTRRLAREMTHRAAVISSLSDLGAATTVEATALDICAKATALDGVNWAIVMAREATGAFRVLAELGPISLLPSGHRRSAERSAYLAERAAAGPWFEDINDATDPHLVAMHDAGIRRVASAPLTAGGDRVIGVIRLGGSDDSEDALAERLVAAREFGAVAGALLAPGLERQAEAVAARERIKKVIAEGAFYPVFQPILDLESRRVVGFEALTRFTDGARPDIRFGEASLTGLGIQLEIATLAEAMRASVALPTGTYVSLNVSSELACHPSGVVAALGSLDRDVVLEITEHAAVESYDTLRGVLGEFGDRVRIAVDDAGAGFAGLQHILEIGPDLVKLDIALVRGVDGDPARRAMIGGMVAFARDTGSTLLAEGIEVEAEAETLRALGVTLGQGFLFGRPVRTEATAEPPTA